MRYLTDALYSVSELNTERYMAAMANDNETSRLLTEAAEKIRREGYIAGWRAAIAAVRAASEMVDEPVEGFEIADILAPSGTMGRPGEPKAGSTPSYVLQAVKKKHGMTGSEVVSVVQEAGHKVSDGSIRTTLMRLERKKLIVSRHKRWFPQGA